MQLLEFQSQGVCTEVYALLKYRYVGIPLENVRQIECAVCLNLDANCVKRVPDPTRNRISAGRRKLPRLGQPKPERFERGAILTRKDAKTNPHAKDANSD